MPGKTQPFNVRRKLHYDGIDQIETIKVEAQHSFQARQLALESGYQNLQQQAKRQGGEHTAFVSILEVEPAAEHDLGAGGVVAAERFAVEIQLTNGEIRRQTALYDSLDAAETACELIEKRIENGEYDDAFTAYVITADEKTQAAA